MSHATDFCEAKLKLHTSHEEHRIYVVFGRKKPRPHASTANCTCFRDEFGAQVRLYARVSQDNPPPPLHPTPHPTQHLTSISTPYCTTRCTTHYAMGNTLHAAQHTTRTHPTHLPYFQLTLCPVTHYPPPLPSTPLTHYPTPLPCNAPPNSFALWRTTQLLCSIHNYHFAL